MERLSSCLGMVCAFVSQHEISLAGCLFCLNGALNILLMQGMLLFGFLTEHIYWVYYSAYTKDNCPRCS